MTRSLDADWRGEGGAWRPGDSGRLLGSLDSSIFGGSDSKTRSWRVFLEVRLEYSRNTPRGCVYTHWHSFPRTRNKGVVHMPSWRFSRVRQLRGPDSVEIGDFRLKLSRSSRQLVSMTRAMIHTINAVDDLDDVGHGRIIIARRQAFLVRGHRQIDGCRPKGGSEQSGR